MATIDFSKIAEVPDNTAPILGSELIFGSASRSTLPMVYKLPFTTSGVTNPVVTFFGVVAGRNNLTVTDGSVTNFRITNDLVGVGTASPDAALTVQKDGTHSYDLLTLKNSSNTNSIPVRMKLSGGSGGFLVNTTVNIYNNATTSAGAIRQNGSNINSDGAGGLTVSASNVAGELRFYAGGTADTKEAIHVFANGRTSIGYSGGSYVDNGYALEVYGTLKATNLVGALPWSSISGGELTIPLNEAPITNLASAGAMNISAVQSNTLNITGSATINSLGTAASGIKRTLIFAGSLTVTHNATSLILPTSANIVTAAGDVMEIESLGSGNWKCINYQRLTGKSVGLSNVDNTSDANKPVSSATQTALNLKENSANKNVLNGYVGINGANQIVFRSNNGTVTSTFTNYNTVARDYTFPNKTMTVAGTDDIPALASTAPANLAASAAVGSGTTSARADHVHANPSALQTGASIPNAVGSAATSLTATGIVQGTALPLTADYNKITTTPASSGVLLPSAAAGKSMTVINAGASTLYVYPATSQSIDALGANNPFPLIVGGMLELKAVNGTQWDSSASLVAGASSAVSITNDVASGSTVYPVWSSGTSGNVAAKVSNTKLSFVPSTGILTATGFVGVLTGNASSATTATNATNTTNVGITDDVATAAVVYPTWVSSTSGNNAAKTSSSKLTFNPSTGVLTATSFSGTFSGNATNVTGIVSGANGGTGVDNTGKTITLGGNFTTSGAFPLSIITTASTTVTFPTSGNVISSVTAIPAVTGTPSSTTYLRGDGTWATVSGGGGGSVTSVSVVSANGFAGSVANAASTPAITVSTTITGILKGNGTAISEAVAGDFPTLNQNTTGTASIATNTTITNDIATATTVYPTWVSTTTGNLPQKTSSTKLSFVPSTGVLTAVTFSGALSGNATTATTATNATNIEVTNDSTNPSTTYPVCVQSTGGNAGARIASAKLSFVPSTGVLSVPTVTATTFNGTLNGSATSATTATNANNFVVANNTTSSSTVYPMWTTSTSGNTSATVSNTKLSFVPNTGILTVAGGIVANGFSVGYLEIPQNSQSTAYTTVLSDGGKHILHPSADTTARTFTIPANASVAYPIGTAITFVNQNAAGVLTIAITSDTMRLAGAGLTGSRTLAANGTATALKLTATEWIISGTNLS